MIDEVAGAGDFSNSLIRSVWKCGRGHDLCRDHVPDVHECRSVGEPPRGTLPSAYDRRADKAVSFLAFLSVLVDSGLAQRPARRTVVSKVKSGAARKQTPPGHSVSRAVLLPARSDRSPRCRASRCARPAWSHVFFAHRRLSDEQRRRHRVSGKVRIDRQGEFDRRNE